MDSSGSEIDDLVRARSPSEAGEKAAVTPESSKTKNKSSKTKKVSGGKRTHTGRKAHSLNEKLCECCSKWYPISEFPGKSSHCHRGRKAMNNIYNAAKTQKELPWYYEQLSDTKKRKALLSTYFKRCPEPKANKKREAFYIAQWREQLRLKDASIRDDIGEMMSMSKYIDWAMKPKNLGSSMPEAQADWGRLCDDPDALTDDEGPPRSPKRFWV